MKFEQRDLGESSEASSGGGGRGMRRELMALLALSAITLVVIWGIFDGLSRLAVRAITPEMESQWLGALMPSMDEWKPTSEEEIRRVDMIRSSMDRLTAHPDAPGLEFRLIIIDDSSPNAFAIPGGVIGFTHGMIDALEDNEIAAAFVIAHELGHFAHRDHLRGLIREIGSFAALQILFGGGGNLMFQTNDLMNLQYSRRQEEAADAYAIQLLIDVYGHSKGAEQLFDILSKSPGLPDWAHMFSTHPNPRDRMKRLREAADSIE